MIFCARERAASEEEEGSGQASFSSQNAHTEKLCSFDARRERTA